MIPAFVLVSAAALAGLVIIDGDTVDLDGARIRIANIDAPETRGAQCDAERRLGMIAARRLQELLTGGHIAVISGDPVSGRKVDRHGRQLATILVDGRDVGEILIEEDLARPWRGRREPWCL